MTAAGELSVTDEDGQWYLLFQGLSLGGPYASPSAALDDLANALRKLPPHIDRNSLKTPSDLHEWDFANTWSLV